MTYVDAFWNKERNCIDVVERVNSRRVYQTWPTRFLVAWPSIKGTQKSIYDTPLDKFETNKWEEFQRELRQIPKEQQYEADMNPMFRCFYDHYKTAPAPDLHVAFFDIETDFDPDRGFSDISEAFNPITAISVYCNWLETNFTLVLAPRTYTQTQAQEICEKFDDTVLCESEKELLDVFLTFIEDADVLTGWNSEGYDIPYLVNRMVQVMGKEHTRRLCLWNKLPKKREYESYGKPTFTYDLSGRVHLDYLQLYRKHTYHEMHSYRLDFVGEYEVGDKKIAYEGSLDKLYNEDFEKFIEYNRQDVMLLVKIDQKLKFIDLSNDLAHENGVLMSTTMGSVQLIDNAITNEAHDRHMLVPIKQRAPAVMKNVSEDEHDDEPHGIVGAYVADPVQGLHDWIGGVDINSLYPSTIRSLNMSKETVVGQIRSDATDRLIQHRMQKEKRTFADAWNEMFGTLEYTQVMNKELIMLTVDLEDGTQAELSGAELYDWIFNNPKRSLTVSANGTIFDQSKAGVVPGLLARWYAERKQLQAEYRKYAQLAQEETDAEKKILYKKQAEFYDRRQLIKKIVLNSLYGAIGNEYSAWFDARIAQSTTLCGRCIVRHMGSKINEVIAGEYSHKGASVIYGDTDSIYFSAYPVMNGMEEFKEFSWSKEDVIDLYDQIADITNASFPDFMKQSFNVNADRSVIKAGRELVASKGMFITKKRYAVLIYDKEGTRKDVNGKPGEIKAMGLDLKRSDTPKPVQEFLHEVLVMALTDGTQAQVFDRIKRFRTEFASWPAWAKGTPKRVNKLTYYGDLMRKQEGGMRDTFEGKASDKKAIPGHVRASLNWNRLKDIYNDHGSMVIQDGFKVIVAKLRPNHLGLTSVAYPVDQAMLPDWFKQLPFDDELMAESLITKKIENLLGVLKWDLNEARNNETFDNMFSF
jgi:DNA polymerase elongation subunit (family B)